MLTISFFLLTDGEEQVDQVSAMRMRRGRHISDGETSCMKISMYHSLLHNASHYISSIKKEEKGKKSCSPMSGFFDVVTGVLVELEPLNPVSS